MTVARVSGWVEVSESGSTSVLRIGGELDFASRNSIEPAVMAAIVSADSVIIDLTELTFCDSSGTAMFIAAHGKARAERTALEVRNVFPPVRRVLEITSFDTVIELIA